MATKPLKGVISRPSFAFTGTIYSATVDVTGDLIVDKEARMKAVLARQ